MEKMADVTANLYSRDRAITSKGTVFDYHADQAAKDELIQAENTLKNVDADAFKKYSIVNESTGMEEFEEFKAAAEAKIKEINTLNGSIYTDEGKAAQIREDISKLADEYIRKEEEKNRVKAITLEELKTKLDDDIASSAITSEEALQMEHFKATTQTELSFATHARQVESILKTLVDQAERNPMIAKFITSYGYLFAEKVDQLATDDDKVLSKRHVWVLIDRAKQSAYSKSVKSKMRIRQEIDKKYFGSGTSKRLINMHKERLLKTY